MIRCKLHSFVVSTFLLLSSSLSNAQAHKGISFQGVIKLPSGEYPTKNSGLTVNAYILSDNNCILREELFADWSISNGYINIPIGTGVVTGDDPGLTMKQVMDNSSPIVSGPTKPAGLVCLDTNGNVNAGVTSFNPASGDGRRKFRLSVSIDGVPIVADFNMRSMAYAISAESADDSKKLNGKADTSFIQTSTNITQTAAESWFSSLALLPIINGTYNAPSASTLSVTLPVNKGGTNLTSLGTANQLLGVNAGGNGLEYKTLGGLAAKSEVDLSGADATGFLAAARFPAMTGAVTNTAGSLATILSDNAVTTTKINNLAVTDAKINDVSASKITGTVSVAKGGTGAATLAANNVILGNGTSAVQTVAPGTSGNVLTSNGTTWVSQAASGGGRTSCPAGFTLIGTSGSAEAFCISTNEEASANWLNATTACYNKTPTKARLCSSGEWAMACVSGLPTGMTGNWEWVADLYTNGGQIMGSPGCDSFSASGVSSSFGSRCCFR